MLSCCYFCSDKHRSPCTGYRSSTLSLFSGTSKPFLLAFLYCFAPVSSYRLFLKSFLSSQKSKTSLVTQGSFFSAAFRPKYRTGCVSHYCIVGGNHAVNVYVIIPQVDEWCKFPIPYVILCSVSLNKPCYTEQRSQVLAFYQYLAPVIVHLLASFLF